MLPCIISQSSLDSFHLPILHLRSLGLQRSTEQVKPLHLLYEDAIRYVPTSQLDEPANHRWCRNHDKFGTETPSGPIMYCNIPCNIFSITGILRRWMYARRLSGKRTLHFSGVSDDFFYSL